MNGIFIYILIAIIAVVLFVHYRYVRKLVSEHNMEMGRLNADYERNHAQILRRESGLNSYDFLTYNLRQSLIVQPGITIDV